MKPQKICLFFGIGILGLLVFLADRTRAAETISLLAPDLAGWQSFSEKAGTPTADVWKLGDDGVLVCTGSPKGYLATEKEYADFILAFDYRRPEGKTPGKGGVLVRITGPDRIWPKSLKAQINAGEAGDFWGLAGYTLEGPADRLKTLEHPEFGILTNLKKTADVEKPVGQWNHYEIVAVGDTVTLSINGVEVNRATGCSAEAGKICLTAEGDEIHFRNIELTPLKVAEPVELFNGKDLQGWSHFLVDPNVKREEVWSVQDGVLVCKGEPMGYLASDAKFENFHLTLQWRWPPDKAPGNSGVLLRITGQPAALPRCVEAQLKSGSAGDIWAFKGFACKGPEDRMRTVTGNPELGDFMGVAKLRDAELPPGQWNQYDILLVDGVLTIHVNGQFVNRATDCDIVAGQIGAQSEGGEIHFRRIRVLPLE